MEEKRHNWKYCGPRNRGGCCPCLTCIHDKRVGDPETDTMCCDLVEHRTGCRDLSPCPDYEPEETKQ